MSPSVSAGIAELAEAGRLSATSAMVTFPEWAAQARLATNLRPRIAVGLHLNLTVGAPLGALPGFAPGERLPAIGDVIKLALRGGIDLAEIEAETHRQLMRFANEVGHPPDFLDGHQHVHALPRVRDGVLAALARFGGASRILVRDPADRFDRIVRRRVHVKKAITVAGLARGFGKAARAAGHPVNAGFAGFSGFSSATPFAAELGAAFAAPGPRHMIMCHPGRIDDVIATRDSVVERRLEELTAIAAAQGLPARLWRPDRTAADLWGYFRE